MVKDPDSPILDHAKAGAERFHDAGIALHTALKPFAHREFEEATDDFRAASDHLERAVEEIRTAVDLANQAIEEDLIRTADEEFGDEKEGGGGPDEEFVFEVLRRKADTKELFYGDEEMWRYLETAARTNDPFAGYEMLAVVLSRLRDHVDGLVHDIENGADAVHVQNAGWRMLRLYLRAMNLAQMISYVNRETRGGVS